MTEPQTHAFQAEVTQVLKLVIHSLYSHKEVFLRELISNASDALDRLRFRAVTESDVMADDPTLEIRLSVDEEQGVLRIVDTGVGMTEAEVIKNLGTIAHSGARSFLEQLTASGKPDLNLIGQFGVGFYSAFLVAERVEVVTRAAGRGGVAIKWSSDAEKTFTVEPATRVQRGTEVVLHLREDQREFLQTWRLRELCKRYSDYVSHPIKLEVQEKDGTRFEQVNRASALWRRPKAEIADADYEDLYKHLTHDAEPPLGRTHFRIEGKQELAALLYIPSRASYNVEEPNKRRGVRLFVQRVFVTDDCEEILPQWLRFVRGVIDSDDLPLNVSRQTLQDSSIVRAIRTQVIKRTLDLLDDIAKNRPTDYARFWTSFGPVLKEGLVLESEHRGRLADLVRYESTHGEGLTSLTEYLARAPENQAAIYYAFGSSKAMIAGLPYLEGLTSRGYEVLYMTHPGDEWAAERIAQFGGKPLVSVMNAELLLASTDSQPEAGEGEATALEPLVARMGQTLASQIRGVKVSRRLTDSPCCLVLVGGATPAYLEQLLNKSARGVPHVKRILEINPSHSLIKSLSAALARDSESPRIDEWIEVLYNQALLTEGSPISDPNRFAKHIATLLTEAIAQ